VRQRPVAPVGEDLLHDGIVAVLVLGLDQVDRGIRKTACYAAPNRTFWDQGARLLADSRVANIRQGD